MTFRQFFSRLYQNPSENFILKILLFPLQVLSYLYLLIIKIKNFLYRTQILKQIRLESFVISVGNIVIGGTGKTPAVITIADHLKKNYRVGVIARTYNPRIHKGNSGGAVEKDDPELVGDEPALLKSKLDSAIVYAGVDKSELAIEMEKKHAPEIIIIDDGFSHQKLARDFDIIMMDAENPFGNGFLLPRGPFREPVSSLKRADALLIKIVDEVKDTKNIFKDIQIPAYKGIIRLRSIKKIPDDEIITGVAWKKILAFSGIGNFESFKKTLQLHNFEPLDFIEFEDHINYDKNKVFEIDNFATQKGAEYCICTEKDAVKLKKVMRDMKTRTVFCYISVHMEIEEKFFEDLENKIKRWLSEQRTKKSCLP